MVVEFTVITGIGFTVTVETAVAEQPELVPVTVYEVVVVGETDNGFAVDPVLQLYEVAPAPVKVAVLPAQMVGEFTVTTGNGFTVTVATAVPVHPPVVPVTV